MSDLRVVVAEPGKAAEVRTIPNTLSAMQAIVGGYIEAFSLGWPDLPELVGFCNEDGISLHLPLNRSFRSVGIILGSFFVCNGADLEGHLRSLTDAQVIDVCQRLNEMGPYVWLKNN